MKRIILIALAFALPVSAQQATPAQADPTQIIVATVNGENITQAKLDQLWQRAGTRMRAQYEKTGGKMAFLDNYIGKRLLVQEALKANFQERPEIQAEMEAARESALFDRYVRDVLSAAVVSEGEIRKYYDEHKSEFTTPEKIKVRHIVVTPKGKSSPEEARSIIQLAGAELHRHLVTAQGNADKKAGNDFFLMKFGDVARRYSEDGTKEKGGDLGWAPRGLFDSKFEEAAFSLTPGTMSGIVETQFGLHIIYLEDRTPAGTETYDEARPAIREFMLAQKAAEVVASVNRLTTELRQTSKVSVYPERVK